MSPRGALVTALAAVILLAALALWLVNVPLWAAAAFALLAGGVTAAAIRRWSSRRDRQKTEA